LPVIVPNLEHSLSGASFCALAVGRIADKLEKLGIECVRVC
jgi:hypothetical protein